MKKAKTQTEYEYVAADDLRPPLLETDSKGMPRTAHVHVRCI